MLITLSELAPTIVTSLSVLTVIGQILAALLLAALLFKVLPRYEQWIRKHALVLMFIVALTATLGSLYFSDIAGWTPCKKCWLQRIFMYPQVVLLAIALPHRNKSVAPHILALSVIGALIASDHWLEQVSAALNPPEGDLPCDDTGVSCASTPFFHFGYITIPMMALTGFVLNGLGAWVLMRKR